jgi:hypothetical protein
MWEKLQRFRALDPRARRLFLRAAVVLPFVSMSLRWRGFRATQASLRNDLSPSLAANPVTIEQIAMTVQMVRAASRHGFVRASCLEESLTLWWLLAKQGISSDLRIGVRKDAQSFEAHAWVERDGVALNEPEARHVHYSAFEPESLQATSEMR